jgi:Tol biopolymer transport system component
MSKISIHRSAIGAVAASMVMVMTLSLAAPTLGAPKTQLVSKATSGARGNRESYEPSVSRTGRFVAFASRSNNLVAGDANNAGDCFVRDNVAQSTELISWDADGEPSNAECDGPSISDNGRYVAFEATASDLVANDTNDVFDIFVHDRTTNQTRRVSVRSNGDEGDGPSRDPAISADGRFVAFESRASNLVTNDTNGRWDVFVHEIASGDTRRVSVRSNGGQGNADSRDPSISGNGRIVTFESRAGNLVGAGGPTIWHVFVNDRGTGRTTRVSVNSAERVAQGGPSTNPTISTNGRYVAFDSTATNLVSRDRNRVSDVFVRDRTSGKTTRASIQSDGGQVRGSSKDPTISGNGRYIVFESSASNLVANDTNGTDDIFVHDRVAKRTRRVNLSSAGTQARRFTSRDGVLSYDGRYVVFESLARNLVPNDNNGSLDVFRRGPL